MKHILLMLTTFAASICATAQSNDAAFYIPLDMTDWVRIEGENINLREQPSPSAPRLMYKTFEECMDCVDVTWGQKETTNLHALQGYTGLTGPMLDRNHNYNPKYDEIPDGFQMWVKMAAPFYGDEYPVWVMQKFTDIRPFATLYPENYYKDDDQKYDLHIRTEGQYAGLCIYRATMQTSMDDPEGIYVGKIVDGMALLPLRFNGYLTSNEDDEFQKVEFGANFRGNTYLGFPSSYRVPTRQWSSDALDFSKLSDKDITELLKHCEPDGIEIVLFENPFEGGYLQSTISTTPNQDGLYDWCGFRVEKKSLPLGKNGNPRTITNPSLSYINPGVKLERVLVQPDGTTLEMSFVNTSGLRQWNVNCYAYITCDATPGKQYKLLRTRGVNISPKPTNVSGNRNERISFSMTFEPIPLYAKTLTLVEGSSKDNFHANDVDISEKKQDVSNSLNPVREVKSNSSRGNGILDDLILEPEPQNNGKVFANAEVAPSFPGGAGAMMSWIGNNMKYPGSAQSKNIQGKVIVKFVVLSDGSIGDIQVSKSVEPSLDNEAVRLVKAMPKWNPGTFDGKPVNVWYTLPINFKLN